MPNMGSIICSVVVPSYRWNVVIVVNGYWLFGISWSYGSIVLLLSIKSRAIYSSVVCNVTVCEM